MGVLGSIENNRRWVGAMGGKGIAQGRWGLWEVGELNGDG